MRPVERSRSRSRSSQRRGETLSRPTTPPLLCCSEDEPDDAELVHSAAGRCSDDEPLSALTPEGAKQLQGEPPQDELGDSQLEGAQHREEHREESQGHEVSQLDPEPSKPNESFRALYERLAHSEPEPRCL